VATQSNQKVIKGYPFLNRQELINLATRESRPFRQIEFGRQWRLATTRAYHCIVKSLSFPFKFEENDSTRELQEI
jgi:hypothetical protein